MTYPSYKPAEIDSDLSDSVVFDSLCTVLGRGTSMDGDGLRYAKIELSGWDTYTIGEIGLEVDLFV